MCVSCREKRQRWIFLQGRVRGWFHESAERQQNKTTDSNDVIMSIWTNTGWKMEWFKNDTFTLGFLQGEHRMYYRHFFYCVLLPTHSYIISPGLQQWLLSAWKLTVPFFLKCDISGTPWRYFFNFDSNCPLRTQGWNDVSISNRKREGQDELTWTHTCQHMVIA